MNIRIPHGKRNNFERQRLPLLGASGRTYTDMESLGSCSHIGQRKGSKHQLEYERCKRHNKVDFWKCYNLHSNN